jgi:hypothetical protein
MAIFSNVDTKKKVTINKSRAYVPSFLLRKILSYDASFCCFTGNVCLFYDQRMYNVYIHCIHIVSPCFFVRTKHDLKKKGSSFNYLYR